MTLQIGDRVSVARAGPLFGRCGSVVALNGDRVSVRGDGGGVREFRSAELFPVPGTDGEQLPLPMVGDAPPQPLPMVGDAPPQPLPMVGDAPPQMSASSVRPSPGFAELIGLLAWCASQISTVGTLDGWIETETRNGRTLYRLRYHKASGLKSKRIAPKHVHDLRSQIHRGRIVRTIHQLIRLLEEL